MKKLYHEGEGVYLFNCPGCKCGHQIQTTVPHENGSVWNFNGDEEKPTFSPSYLIKYADGQICHSYIKDGRIEFISDCTHDLKGQTVDLPDWDQG